MEYKKYIFLPSNRAIFTVVSNRMEYMIIPDTYCTCKGFYYYVIHEDKKDCKHLREFKNITSFTVLFYKDSYFKTLKEAVYQV